MCYDLSFVVITLNTNLHRSSVKEKPAVEQFVNINKGIIMGDQDLPMEMLEVSSFCYKIHSSYCCYIVIFFIY